MFSGDATEGTAMMAELFKFRGGTVPINGITDGLELSEEKILESLQTMAGKYGNYVFHDIFISIQVMSSMDYYTYSHSTGIKTIDLNIY